MKNIPQLYWKPLNEAEQEEFKKWAKDNFKPNEMDIEDTWHPLTRATCWEMMAEYHGSKTEDSNPGGTKLLYDELVDYIVEFQAETKAEEVTIWMYLRAILAHQENQLLNP
jgi:hypothetical protein